jgi:hypothetical protein
VWLSCANRVLEDSSPLYMAATAGDVDAARATLSTGEIHIDACDSVSFIKHLLALSALLVTAISVLGSTVNGERCA